MKTLEGKHQVIRNIVPALKARLGKKEQISITSMFKMRHILSGKINYWVVSMQSYGRGEWGQCN